MFVLGDIILISVASSEECMSFLKDCPSIESNVSQSQAHPGFCGALNEGKQIERSLIHSPAQPAPSPATGSQLLDVVSLPS